MNTATLPFELLTRVAATLKPCSGREVEHLFEKLIYAAPEIVFRVLFKGVGIHGGLDYLCRTYGTETTKEAYDEAVLKIRQCTTHPTPTQSECATLA